MAEQPTTNTTDLGRTVWGLDANVAAVFAYAIGWVSGIVLLLVEPNKFVRFHAWQSTIAFGGLSLAWMVALSLGPPGWNPRDLRHPTGLLRAVAGPTCTRRIKGSGSRCPSPGDG
jgi:hypothetical protein